MFTRARIESAIATGKLSPAARSMSHAEVLHQYVQANALTQNEALAELAPPRYWVLCASGYADTVSDYVPADSKRDAALAGLVDLGYLENPACTVFAGERVPWDEEDAYPDWVVEFGPRGGVKWERA